MLLALLFIPAMNLCGMISSRMDERLSEMGLRKAYGATNGSLIGQVLTENLLLTFIGGLSGLALAYLITLVGGEVILNLLDENVTLFTNVPTKINMEMLINLPLFLTVFGICLLLNLISALVPTLLALRHPIIYSIQTKR
jgi:ABC-type antimicrobial peptide transport system permease subunit